MPAKRKLDIAKFRAQLEEKRQELLEQLDAIAERTARKSDPEALAEEQDFDDAPGDAAIETLERGQEMALEDNIEDLLQRVDAALLKIEKGTYGTCDACRGNIKVARLKALPWATLCLECQSRMERL